MPSKTLNRGLHAAKAAKQDEFYTRAVHRAVCLSL